MIVTAISDKNAEPALGRAMEAYLLGLWPYERREGVIALGGDDTAKRLLPRLKQLADEAFHWAVDRQRHDDVSASRIVEVGIAVAHPELDRDAVRALRAHYDFCHSDWQWNAWNHFDEQSTPKGQHLLTIAASGIGMRSCAYAGRRHDVCRVNDRDYPFLTVP